MKAFLIGSGLLAASLAVLFFVTEQAVSENTASASHSVSVESNHPLAMAHQELKQAHDDFQERRYRQGAEGVERRRQVAAATRAE